MYEPTVHYEVWEHGYLSKGEPYAAARVKALPTEKAARDVAGEWNREERENAELERRDVKRYFQPMKATTTYEEVPPEPEMVTALAAAVEVALAEKKGARA